MRLDDLDYTALINQMWGSEANLQSFLDSEVPNLCSRICGPDAPVPVIRITYPKFKGEAREGSTVEFATSENKYRPGSSGTPATISISALVAGNKPRLPQFIAFGLIHHWEALGAIGENRFDYPEAVVAMVKEPDSSISEEQFKEIYSPQFISKALTVARDLEIPIREFLFPRLSLTIQFPRPQDGAPDST